MIKTQIQEVEDRIFFFLKQKTKSGKKSEQRIIYIVIVKAGLTLQLVQLKKENLKIISTIKMLSNKLQKQCLVSAPDKLPGKFGVCCLNAHFSHTGKFSCKTTFLRSLSH